MELGIETEHCSSKINNESSTSKKTDFELIHENDIEIHDEVDSEKGKEIKKRVKGDDKSDGDIKDNDVDFESYFKKFKKNYGNRFAMDPMDIDSESSIINKPSCSKDLLFGTAARKSLDYEMSRKKFTGYKNIFKLCDDVGCLLEDLKKLEETGNFKTLSTNKKNTDGVGIEKHFDLPAAKGVNHAMDIDSELSIINKPSCSKDLRSPPSLSDLLSASCSKDLRSPPSLSDLLSASCSKDLRSPPSLSDLLSASCSKDLLNQPRLSDLVSTSSSNDLPCPPRLSDLLSASCSKDLPDLPPLSDLLSASCSKDLPCPPRLSDLLSASCSKDLPDLPPLSDLLSASCSKDLPDLPPLSDLLSASCSKDLSSSPPLLDLLSASCSKDLSSSPRLSDLLGTPCPIGPLGLSSGLKSDAVVDDPASSINLNFLIDMNYKMFFKDRAEYEIICSKEIEELNSEVQSIVEEGEIESPPLLEKDAIFSSKFVQTKSTLSDDTTEVEINTDSIGIGSINTNAKEPIDKKIKKSRIENTKIKNIDLLKPIPLNLDETFEKNFAGQCNREELLAKWESSYDESLSEYKKNKNLLDIEAVRKIMQNPDETENGRPDETKNGWPDETENGGPDESSMEHDGMNEFIDVSQGSKDPLDFLFKPPKNYFPKFDPNIMLYY